MDTTRYWSLSLGNFVDTRTGHYVKDLLPQGIEAPQFTGSIREWHESLVETIVDAINDLQEATFAKFGRAKRLDIDIYASSKMSCVLKRSVLLKLLPEGIQAKDGKSRPIGRFNYPPETNGFNVWEDAVLHDDVIRIVALFDTDGGGVKTMFGNIRILDIPGSECKV